MADTKLRIATFEKIPFEQFQKDLSAACPYYIAHHNPDDIRTAYEQYVKLPVRSTTGSAGYDISTPIPLELVTVGDNKTVTIPTGLRCKIEDGWFLNILPRSGSGFKYGLRLANTSGVIDSDYYNSDNYGHIMIKLTVDPFILQNRVFTADAGTAIAQGIFLQYGLTTDDEATGIRNGGFGSTGL